MLSGPFRLLYSLPASVNLSDFKYWWGVLPRSRLLRGSFFQRCCGRSGRPRRGHGPVTQPALSVDSRGSQRLPVRPFLGSRKTWGFSRALNLQESNCSLLRTWLTHPHSEASVPSLSQWSFPQATWDAVSGFSEALIVLPEGSAWPRWMWHVALVLLLSSLSQRFLSRKKCWGICCCYSFFFLHFLLSAQYLQVLRE